MPRILSKGKESMNYPTIILQGRKDEKDPYCTCFAYSDRGNYFICGYYTDIKEYISKNFRKCLYRIDMWKDKQKRGVWGISLPSPYNGYVLKKRNNRKRFRMLIFGNGTCVELDFRNMPNKLPKEFERFN